MHGPGGDGFACGQFFEARLDGLDGCEFFQGVLDLFISLAAQKHRFRTSVHRQHLGSPGLVHAAQVILGVALEVCERMDVFELEHTPE